MTGKRVESWVGIAGLLLACLAWPAEARPQGVQEELALPGDLTPESMAAIDALYRGLGKAPDWTRIHEDLDRRGDAPVIRFARAWADLLRGAVWAGQEAEKTLRDLRRDALRHEDPASRRLAAHLLVAIGRGQLALRHNEAGLTSLQEAIAELRRIGDQRGLVQALYELGQGLIHQSRRPRDALPFINELLMTAHRQGMNEFVQRAESMYDEWRKLIGEVDDYFGRASNRHQYFPPALGIPADADLVAFVHGVLIMNGDTDDQMQAASPEFMRFDGLFLRKLRMPSDSLELRGSLVDRQGRLWAATNRGLYRYDGATFLHLFNPDLPDEEGNDIQEQTAGSPTGVGIRHVPLLSNIVNEIKQGKDGRFYLATAGGISTFDPLTDAWEHLTSDDAPIPRGVERIAPLPDGGLVVAWRDAYAVRTAEGRWIRRAFEFPPATGRPHGSLFGLMVDREGSAWVHGLGGAHQLRGDRIVRLVDRRFSAIVRNVNHVWKAADGAIWFASTDGLCRQEGNHCASLNAQRWMPAEWSLDLLEGPGGSMWLSVYQGGLNRFMPPHYRQFGVPEGFRQPDNETILRAGEHLLLTSADGLVRLNPVTGRIDHFVSGAEGIDAGELKSSLMLSTGKMVFRGPDTAKGKGFYLFDGREARRIDQDEGLPGERIRGACEPEPGAVLLAYRSGLVRLDADTLEVRFLPAAPGLSGVRIKELVCAPGEPIWLLGQDALHRMEGDRVARIGPAELGIQGKPRRLIRSEEAGVFVLGERHVAWHRDGAWENVPVGDVDFDFRVRDVAADEAGRLYFSTESGVFVFNREDWTRLTVEDGLVSNTAFGMLPDGDRMWITGLGGVVEWSWPEQDPPETFLLVRQHAYHVDPQGRPHRWRVSAGIEKPGWVLFRGLAGTFEIPEDQAGNFLPGEVRGSESGGRACEKGGASWDPEPLEQDHLDAGITAGVPFMDDEPGSLRYHYRVDAGPWRRAPKEGISLSDLEDGVHWLELRATDRRLRQDPTFACYGFLVDTPVSPWLLAGAGVCLGLLVFATRRRLNWFWLRWRHRRFRPIVPSPFNPNRPARGTSLVGREEQLETIRRMTAGGGGVAVVWGERGAGKHSIMLELARRLQAAEVHVAELDLAVAAAGGEVSGLVGKMGQTLVDLLTTRGVELDHEPQLSGDASILRTIRTVSEERIGTSRGERLDSSGSGEGNPFNLLGRALRRMEQALPGSHIVFLLDNAEVLGVALDADAGYGSYLFPFLRSMAQQRSCVTVVLAMEGRWFSLAKRFAQLFSFATPVPVGRLGPEQGQQVLAEGFRDRALVSERELQLLWRTTGGHPYLLQWVGDRIVAELNARQTNVVSRDLIARLQDDLVEDPKSGFESTWMDLSREEKLLVATLGESHPAKPWMSLDELVESLTVTGGKLLLEEVRRAVLALVREGMLEDVEGTYRLRATLFRRWVSRNHSVASVMEESHDYVGHYQLLEKLGGGGMGVVFKARDLVQGETVALKLLRPELSESKRSRRRFLREAKLGKRLRHANIVRILDYGEQAGRLYLAMEFVEGETLASWSRRQQHVPFRWIAEVGRHLASALNAIHRLGIVHRDVKSENIMLASPEPAGATEQAPRGSGPRPVPPGTIKLMDFGLELGEDVSRMTRAGSLLGTVAYMSPEQARGAQVDARTDLYSLGVVLYELCTGKTPFSGNEATVLHAIIYDEVLPLREALPGTPEELSALIGELLSKDPGLRPPSAQEVESRLEGLAAGLGDEATRPRESRADEASSRSHITSRSLDNLRSRSVLLASLEKPTRDSATSLAESAHDSARLLLYRVSAAVARGPVRDEVIEDCLVHAVNALAGERGLVVLLTGEGKLLCVAEHRRRIDDLEKLETLASMLRQTIQRQMGVLFRAEEGEREDDMGAAVCAPMWAGDEIFGALLVDRTGPEAETFGDEDLELLVSIGYLLGLALERERLVERLIHQERLAAAGHMLAGVAHDLRGPMAVISGYAELIPAETTDAERRSGCALIVQQVDEMSHMIANLLAYVRGETTLQSVDIDIRALADDVRDVLRFHCEPKQIDLVVHADGQQARVDPSRAKRIILNLAKNAAEAMGTRGRLEVSLCGQDGGLDIRIQDNGPGIPAELQERLFDPFFTAGKRGGTGLGLAIVRQFVNDHHGHISVDSQVGRGTTFSVRLPRANAPA